MTLQFEWPWVFVLLALPFLVRYLLPSGKQISEAALRTSFAKDLESPGHHYDMSRNLVVWFIALLVWVLMVVAAARPQLLGEPTALPVSGRDLMLAVDVSGSMRQRDFTLGGNRVTRLAATKQVAGDFIERRTGDRVGLILFGRHAYLQTPLTFDRSTVDQLLQEAFIGMAGSETAIGDAIGLAIKRLRDNKVEEKTLILLTDGANTAGAVDPVKAAQLAASAGLTIYTVGIGADSRSFGGVLGGFGGRSSSLDERSLTEIARLTNGRYFRARNSRELLEIYQMLDELEPVSHDTAGFRPTYSIYYYALLAAMFLGSALVAWRLSLWPSIRKKFLTSKGAHV